MEIIFINGKPFVKHEDEYREATPHEMEREGYHD